jgi:hypothetical protein
MSSDKSRSASDRYYDYTGVVSQQGRVIVDRDFNALQDIIDARVDADTLDIIGPCGTPDDGFAISLIEASPPRSLSPPTGHSLDFLIAPGTMYVGGQRVFFPPRPAGHPLSYSYFDQPDWMNPTAPALFGFTADELVYLHLWEQEVSAVEDPDLLDAALGGVDTTQRLRLLGRVRRRQVASADCTAAWQQATASWLAGGQFLDPQSLALLPQAKLKVSFVQARGFIDPCDPVATGGYLGAENQLIRVQIALTDPANALSPRALVWGYDNASLMYRIAAVRPNGTMLQLTRDPPDAFHIPGTGQVVEILRTAVILETDPDTTDPLHQRSIVRCVAEPTGVLARLTRSYGPAQSGDPTNYLVLDRPLPDDYLSDPNPLFVRVWQAALPIPAGGTVELIDPATQTTTGIEVTISVPQSEALWPGSYWLIAVRPSTPQAVYPERLLIAPQPPDGPRQWVCPLAVIDWRAAIVHDCRCPFDTLVELTKRKAGCCTVSISPEDLRAGKTLQSIIDRAAGFAQNARICLGPGTYRLPQTLRLTAMHSGMTIEGCSGGVTITAVANPAPAGLFEGLVMLSGAAGVTLRGLNFEPPAVAVAQFLPQSTSAGLLFLWSSWMGANVAASVLSDIVAMVAVRVLNSANFTAERCGFRFSLPSPQPSFDIFSVGILLNGDCSELTVANCSFASEIAATFTPKPAPPSTGGTTPVNVVAAQRGVAPSVAPATASTTSNVTGTAAPQANLFDVREMAKVFAAGDVAERARLTFSQAGIGIFVPPAPAAIRQPFVATVGCVATPTFNTSFQQPVACEMGDVTFRDNSFDNLAWAIFTWADAVTARIEDNTITRCGGGIWIQPMEVNAINPFNNLITAFQEFPIFWLMPLILYPQQEVIGTRPPLTALPGALSVFMTNNQVETILPSTQLSPPAGGPPLDQSSSSLVALVHGFDRAVDTAASLVISNNRLRNQNSQAPTAFLVVSANPQRMVVSANLIFNEFRRPQTVPPPPPPAPPAPPGLAAPLTNGPSLDIFPVSGNIVGLFTVVGNALLGPTNLGSLLRSDPQTSVGTSWLPFNSIVL